MGIEMTGRLKGTVALVTGGSAGIGRSAALVFAREGAKVVVASDINIAGGRETVEKINGDNGEAIFVKADVSKAADVVRLVDTAVETYGQLDYAFNNAGIPQGTKRTTAELTEEEWDRVIAVNLKSVWLCMKYEVAQMLKQGGGAIVNTSSIAGLHGFPGRAAYAVSKHGIIGLTKTAALEYAKAGIRINTVCPGWIRTPVLESAIRREPGYEAQLIAMEPVGRLGNPEEVAEAVVWLCSDAASFVTGHSMAVDGGHLAG